MKSWMVVGLLALSLPGCGTSEGDDGATPGPGSASGKADEFGTGTDGYETDTDTGGVIGTTDPTGWGSSSSGYWDTDGWGSDTEGWGSSSSTGWCGTGCTATDPTDPTTDPWGSSGSSSGGDGSASGTTD